MSAGGGVGRALLAVARQPLQQRAEVTRLCAEAEPRRLETAARFHRLEQALHLHVRGAPQVDEALRRTVQRAELGQVVQAMKVKADLNPLGALLDQLSVPFLVIKGAVLADTLYAPHPTVRAFSDLDVVVRSQDIAVTVEALIQHGAEPLSPAAAVVEDGVAQVSLRLRHGTLLDLHWQLFSLPFAREAFPWALEESFESAVRVPAAGIRVQTLDPVDTLLHLSAHAALSGASQLGRLVDLALAVDQVHDWHELVERAHARHLGLVVAVMLDRLPPSLGTRLPEAAHRALAPRSAWRALAATADRIRPPASARAGTWSLEGLYRSTRSGTAATIKEAVPELLDRLGLRALEQYDRRQQPPPPPGLTGDRALDLAGAVRLAVAQDQQGAGQ